jgi:hypothetical protein
MDAAKLMRAYLISETRPSIEVLRDYVAYINSKNADFQVTAMSDEHLMTLFHQFFNWFMKLKRCNQRARAVVGAKSFEYADPRIARVFNVHKNNPLSVLVLGWHRGDMESVLEKYNVPMCLAIVSEGVIHLV